LSFTVETHSLEFGMMQQNSHLQKVERHVLSKLLILSAAKTSKVLLGILLTSALLLLAIFIEVERRQTHTHTHEQSPFGHIPDLEMSGGDPYLRALMRTISASESNAKNPYVLLYGGKHTHDLAQHPDLCMPITVGVNHGNCSTAAGRYQFINSTWREKASLYHPNRAHAGASTAYNFAPEYQDKVTYRWLKDDSAWSVSIPGLLRRGEINEVLRILSGTWTSLGFGIETNSMSPYLTEVYQQVLAEELERSQH
jgi:cation efflux system protein involved in nickel and cobalt tolerance